MMVILLFLGALLAISVAVTVVALITAREGYEDELGFHSGASTRSGPDSEEDSPAHSNKPLRNYVAAT